jgi:hypothetical protein
MITEFDRQSIINDRIHGGLDLNKLASKYDCNWRAIKRLLVDTGNYHDTRHAVVVNQWDYDFFNRSDPIVAYWAGFAFADGCIRKHSYGARLCIVIKEGDLGHIQKLAETVHFPVNKIIRGSGGCFVIQLYKHGFSFPEELARWGIVERKSYNFSVPQISDNLIPHFLRGWVDGDGSIHVGTKNQRFEIVGNSLAIEWGIDQFRKIGYSGHISQISMEGKTWGRLCIYGATQITAAANLLFANDISHPKLDRKWEFLSPGFRRGI